MTNAACSMTSSGTWFRMRCSPAVSPWVCTRRWLFLGDVLGLTGLTLILTGLFVAEATGSRFVICIAGFLLVVAAVILQLGDHHP